MKDIAKFVGKERYTVEDLLEIITILRSPEGCPWDREQNHKSIRRDFLEECYEAIEAIDTDNTELLREELGDVLLQVVFHSEIEREVGHFDFSDVVSGVAEKMVVRHPHVFADTEAEENKPRGAGERFSRDAGADARAEGAQKGGRYGRGNRRY